MHRGVFAIVLLAAAIPAQTTRVVSGGGSALQTAINAASPGDILDVMPGSYSAVTAQRGLRISLRAGAAVVVPYLSTASAITIQALPATEAFVVEGGEVQGIAAMNCAGAVIGNRFLFGGGASGSFSRIDLCTGPVAFHQLTVSSLPTFGRFDVTNSPQVSFASCSLPRMSVGNSSATFVACSIRPYGGALPFGTWPSLRIVSGSVAITGGRIEGGVAASLPYHESGIELQQGDLVVTGGAYVQESILWSMPTVPAIATLGGTVRIDPSVALVGTPPIGGPAIVIPGAVPSLAVVRTPGSPSYQVDVAAEPASIVFTLLGLPAPPLSLPWGDAWLDPASPLLDVAVSPQSGTWSFTRSLTNVPPFFALVVQSAALSTNGVITVGAPVRFVWD